MIAADQPMTQYRVLVNLVREQMEALQSTQANLKACQLENQKLQSALGYYASTDWKIISLVDRGERARKILEETNGKGGN